jgi:hypothetical protein
MSTRKAWLVVTDPKAAAVLLDPDSSMLLKPFMRGPKTVHEAATELSKEPTELYYPVRRMHELGILEIAFESPRRGRPLKHYQTSAEGFFVPFQATPFGSVEEFIVRSEEAWSRQLMRSLAKELTTGAGFEHWGLRITYENGFIMHNQSLSPTLGFLPPQEPGSVVTTWDTNFYLSDADVLQLAEEVSAVVERYREKRTGSRRVLRFAIAPWEA